MDPFLVEKTGPKSFRLFGELDLARAGELDLILERETADGGDLTLDLADVKFIDSASIAVFARAARTLEGKGRLFLLSPSREVRLALDLVQLDHRPNIEIVSEPAPRDPPLALD
jgi:anti-anti-sigma factor